MSELKLRFLGSPQIEINGELVVFSRRKSLALLAYLAITAVPHTRDYLATLLWPNLDQSRALAYLRRALWDINHVLGSGWLKVDRDQVGLLPSDLIWVDGIEFQTLIETGSKSALAEAAALYQGDFLAGFTLRDALEFDDWQYLRREIYRRRLGECLQTMIELLAAEGEMETAVSTAHRWLVLDNLNETAHRQLMRLYASMGQRAAAIQQYQTCSQILADEMDVKPDLETQELLQAIKNGEMQVTETAVGKKQSLPNSRAKKVNNNLPVQFTPFIGRVSEMTILDDILTDPKTHLVTLIGPGGIGKTRLALEYATHNQHQFEDGICFIPLTNLIDAKAIPFVIAEALDLHIHAGENPKEILSTWLSTREMLLILDNFEHVLPGTGFVQTLMVAAPHIKLLVTSRERLALQAERLIDVTTLSFPSETMRNPEIEKYESVALFATRASYLRLDFDLDDEQTRADVSRICQLVEGHPLALEMAASWIRSRSLADVVTALSETLGNLQSSMVDVSPKHHSLQAVFDFSWNLIHAHEQEILLQLAVFRGGFDFVAAEYVTGCTHGTLASLMEKSFLRMDENGRYTLHNVYQEFAFGKLQRRPKLAFAAHSRHWSYFANFLAEQEATLKGSSIQGPMDLIHQEFPNIRVAWKWALNHKKFAEMERTLTSLWLYYSEYNSEEGRQLLQQTAEALPLEKGADFQMLYWKIMTIEIYLFNVFKRKEVVEKIAPPILEHIRYQPVADWDMLISFIVGHAAIHGIIDKEEANELEEMFIEKARIDADAYWLSRQLQGVAWCELFVYEPGDLARAEKYTFESLQIAQQHNIALTQNVSLWQMAEINIRQQDYNEAFEYGRLALASCLKSGEISFALVCAYTCIQICLAVGKIDEAREYLLEMLLNPRSQYGDWPQTILGRYVLILYQEGRGIEAASYANTYLHHTPPETVNPEIREVLAKLEGKLSEAEFQSTLVRSRSWSIESVIEELKLRVEV